MHGFVALSILLSLITGCVTQTAPNTTEKEVEFDWRRPANDVEHRFRAARSLAEQLMRLPACRAEFMRLPDWPPGPVPTEIMTQWPPNTSRTLLARTFMSDPPYIQIHAGYLRSAATERAAMTLIHELVHAASFSAFAEIPALIEEGTDEANAKIALIKEENEALAQRIARVCVNAGGII